MKKILFLFLYILLSFRIGVCCLGCAMHSCKNVTKEISELKAVVKDELYLVLNLNYEKKLEECSRIHSESEASYYYCAEKAAHDFLDTLKKVKTENRNNNDFS
jgi:hypothetical protein